MDIAKVDFKPIIEKAKQSEQGLSDLLEVIKPYVLRKANYYLSDDYEAEDVFQVISLRLYNNLDTIDPNRFMSYLKTVVTNACTDVLRKRHKTTEDGHDITTVSLDAFEDWDIADMNDSQIDLTTEYREMVVKEALNTLSNAQREVVILRYIDDMKIKDIASYLNVNENTVKTRMYAAFENIKEEILKVQDRDDIKLYSYSPVLFFLLLLRGNMANDYKGNDLLIKKTIENINRYNNKEQNLINKNISDSNVDRAGVGNIVENENVKDDERYFDKFNLDNVMRKAPEFVGKDDNTINDSNSMNKFMGKFVEENKNDTTNSTPHTSNKDSVINNVNKTFNFNNKTIGNTRVNKNQNGFNSFSKNADSVSNINKEKTNATFSIPELLSKLASGSLLTKVLISIVAIGLVVSIMSIGSRKNKNNNTDNENNIINQASTIEQSSESFNDTGIDNIFNIDFINRGYTGYLSQSYDCPNKDYLNIDSTEGFDKYVSSAPCRVTVGDVAKYEYLRNDMVFVSRNRQQDCHFEMSDDKQYLYFRDYVNTGDRIIGVLKLDNENGMYYLSEKEIRRDGNWMTQPYQDDKKIYVDKYLFNAILYSFGYFDAYSVFEINSVEYDQNYRPIRIFKNYDKELQITYEGDNIKQIDELSNGVVNDTTKLYYNDENLVKYLRWGDYLMGRYYEGNNTEAYQFNDTYETAQEDNLLNIKAVNAGYGLFDVYKNYACDASIFDINDVDSIKNLPESLIKASSKPGESIRMDTNYGNFKNNFIKKYDEANGELEFYGLIISDDKSELISYDTGLGGYFDNPYVTFKYDEVSGSYYFYSSVNRTYPEDEKIYLDNQMIDLAMIFGWKKFDCKWFGNLKSASYDSQGRLSSVDMTDNKYEFEYVDGTTIIDVYEGKELTSKVKYLYDSNGLLTYAVENEYSKQKVKRTNLYEIIYE